MSVGSASASHLGTYVRPVRAATSVTRQAGPTPGHAYAELRRAVTGAGLLERAYGYYLARSGVSFLLLGAAVGAVYALPAGPGWGTLDALLLALGSVQVALIGH